MVADMATHVLMHHPKLKVERRFPLAAVEHWKGRGWKSGGMKSKPKTEDTSGDPTDEQQKGEA